MPKKEQIGFQELWSCSACGTKRAYGLRHDNTIHDGHGHIFKEGAVLYCEECNLLTNHLYTHRNKMRVIKDYCGSMPVRGA